ncbi:hypothetical protein CLV71_126133 [Actinophytocola oryzae]|uniref:TetR family transcriptional regulator n=2 Tax=Actinophytocola oryzae TaxID=502181 RepID=A0A4R7USL0_9PSEU|nr:hypothetical protein CLV71_126133 [Actinophytocola oryzae]
MLAERIHRVAEAGRLRVPEERAMAVLHAAGRGVTLTLIGDPKADPDLSVTAREAVLAAITTDAPAAPEPGPAAAAVTLRALLSETAALTEPERALMAEWLDRIAERARTQRQR